MADNTLYFKANAGLKDILGKGLIYDDNVAIIELIKNAKDAKSPKVKIKFEDEGKISKKSSLTITDFGSGMSIDDITWKWLNMAYSEKKDQPLSKGFAGSKGIGRFSCDRLGKELIIFTKSSKGEYIKFPIEWTKFENKGKEDLISNIPLTYEILDKKSFLSEIKEKDFTTGTVLKIKELRSDWPSSKLKKLISELGKFSPSLDNGFEVELYSDNRDLKGLVNKRINKDIFDKLSFKTTYIKSNIDKNGKNIETTLFYQGNQVYNYSIPNPYKLLKNINIEVHYLDTLSKMYFTKNFGINPVEYGSIFLFYNGYRISPYGNIKNDWLGLDQRKSQGTNRFLGTREILGKINIVDEDNTFSIITSREGLAHTKSFQELVAYDKEEKTTINENDESYGYVTVIIRQLENFVVTGLDWDRIIDKFNPNRTGAINELDIISDPSNFELKKANEENIEKICNRLLKSKWKIKNLTINTNLLKDISKISEEKYDKFVDDFKGILKSKSIQSLSVREKGALVKIIDSEQGKTKKALEELNVESGLRQKAEADKLIALQLAEAEKKRSQYFEDLISPEQNLDALITHVIKQISGGIESNVKATLSTYYKNPDHVSKEELVEILEDVAFDISTIKESAIMSKNANFNMKVNTIKADLFAFIKQYIDKIASREKKWELEISYTNTQDLEMNKVFSPPEIAVLLANIFDNARKAKANTLNISFHPNKIIFTDDGKGLLPDVPYNKFFEKGFSSTDGGFGLGLYHSKLIANNLGAIIRIENNKDSKGAKVILEFKG
ncbi:MAG: ATP-binding protein [Elusimicrobia bacterium]|nr:ATP-binding protein [Elusimicrobiota bacterium]